MRMMTKKKTMKNNCPKRKLPRVATTSNSPKTITTDKTLRESPSSTETGTTEIMEIETTAKAETTEKVASGEEEEATEEEEVASVEAEEVSTETEEVTEMVATEGEEADSEEEIEMVDTEADVEVSEEETETVVEVVEVDLEVEEVAEVEEEDSEEVEEDSIETDYFITIYKLSQTFYSCSRFKIKNQILKKIKIFGCFLTSENYFYCL